MKQGQSTCFDLDTGKGQERNAKDAKVLREGRKADLE